MGDYAADAIALLDHLEWDTARVVGVSFGGMVAQEVAVTYPDRVECLALLCTSPGGAGGASYPLHELAAVPTDERAATMVQLVDTRFTAEWLADHPGDQAIVDAMGERRRAEQTPGEALQLDARSRHDVWDRLLAVTAPTFVAAGRYDGIAPLANSEAIAGRIPDSQLHVYEGGHAFFFQDRAALPQIRNFLSRSTLRSGVHRRRVRGQGTRTTSSMRRFWFWPTSVSS